MPMTTLDDNSSNSETQTYQVEFYDSTIQACVTTNPSFVDDWISFIESINRRQLQPLIVGLDVEWRPYPINFLRRNAVATLQLCVGSHCLIYQLLHTPSIPQSLRNFLNNPAYTFVGVGVLEDVDKIAADYGLTVRRVVELRELAAFRKEIEQYRNSGLKGLSLEILGRVIEKPKNITLSCWDNRFLNADQVQYACLDAFISFDLGMVLNAARCIP